MESLQLIEPDYVFPKLKPGPGLPPETVLADQRRRLQGAILRIVLNGGWRQVKVREVVRTAGVSTSSFYKHFANADECFASALDAAVDDLLGEVGAAPSSDNDWRQLLRTTIEEVLDRFGSNRATAQLALVESFAAGPTTRKLIGVTARRLEEILGGCFSASSEKVWAPRHLVAGMTGGIVRVLRTTVAAGRGGELPRLAGPLTDWLLSLPGPEVVSLPAAGTRHLAGSPPGNPLSLLGASPADDRRRLLQTVMRLAAENGFGDVTAPRVRRDAGVPRRRFDEIFIGVDQCFLEAIDALVQSVATKANEPKTENWTRRSHRSIASLCSSAADNRRLARVAFLEILAPGRYGILRREQIIGQAATALRRTIPEEERPSPMIAEASVAAAWHVAQSDVHAGRARSLPSIAPLLSYLVLAPIVGAKPAVAAIRAEAREGELVNA